MNTGQKIAKLIFLVNEYLKYTVWTNVGVTLKFEKVFVTWFSPIKEDDDNGVYVHFTVRSFPIEDLDVRIIAYKNKIRYEKKKRLQEYNNDRVETEPENTPKK